MPAKLERLLVLIISNDQKCIAWIEQALMQASEFQLTRFEYLDFEHCIQVRGKFPEADVLLVDLERTYISPTRFWVLARMLYDQTPIVAITKNNISHPTVWSALHARVDQLIALGCSEKELQERIRLASQGQTSLGYIPAALEAINALFNHVQTPQINLITREAKIGGHLSRLTILELKLLVYLNRHKSRLVTWRELLSEVWKCPPKAGGTQDQVKSCVKRLRQKIEPIPQHPTILLSDRNGYSITNIEFVTKDLN